MGRESIGNRKKRAKQEQKLAGARRIPKKDKRLAVSLTRSGADAPARRNGESAAAHCRGKKMAGNMARRKRKRAAMCGAICTGSPRNFGY